MKLGALKSASSTFVKWYFRLLFTSFLFFFPLLSCEGRSQMVLNIYQGPVLDVHKIWVTLWRCLSLIDCRCSHEWLIQVWNVWRAVGGCLQLSVEWCRELKKLSDVSTLVRCLVFGRDWVYKCGLSLLYCVSQSQCILALLCLCSLLCY